MMKTLYTADRAEHSPPTRKNVNLVGRLSRGVALGLSLVLLSACLGQNPTESNSSNNTALSPNQTEAGRTRYSFNDACIALKVADSDQFLIQNNGQWGFTGTDNTAAQAIRFKASALGEYLLYTQDSQLLTFGSTITTTELADANPMALWTLKVYQDSTQYPVAPSSDLEADPAIIAAYTQFKDPNVMGKQFQLANSNNQFAGPSETGTFSATSSAQPLELVELPQTRCAQFPEAQSNVEGETFSGKELLGWADTHLHATSTHFLGGAKPGVPFHKFGVTHALESCEGQHGPTGHGDVVGSLFTGDVDGHKTDGWPTFSDWPSRTATTHEATYWKWIERSWKSGLRLIVNFAVDNQTLCEIQRNVAGTPALNCNEMSSAKKQLNTAWAMQDYIDAQYGGRGNGWWRVVTSPAQAREVIAKGKAAVLLGVEISNLLDCSVTFNPLNTQEGFEETHEPVTGQFYGCRMTETGAPDEILTQLKNLKAIGVSNLFTVHEFDNAFGGSDIFEGLVLNLGTKENSGGITNIEKGLAQSAGQSSQTRGLQGIEPNGLGIGEFWTTHTCPSVDSPEAGGSIFPALGATMTNLGPPPPGCTFAGRGGRPGGKTACYPAEPQCNARTLTPIGLYTFGKIMELGFNFEIDHLAYEMKNQLLDLTAAQKVKYPTISAHGFSGLSVVQAKRIYEGGGLVYPTYNDTPDLIALWSKLRSAWKASGTNLPFAMGFGSDTNGLSPQAAPRPTITEGREVQYPFTLFQGGKFEELDEFKRIKPLAFEQPSSRAPTGEGRTWHVDQDGNAHYGMAELNQDAPAQMLSDLYGSARAYVEFWERTHKASESIQKNGLLVPKNLLRPAPRNP